MKIVTESFKVQTQGNTHILDITPEMNSFLKKLGMSEGQATAFCPGSTGGITTIEYEPGMLKDIPEALEIVAPSGKDYHHHLTWHDDNGSSHVRSALIGPSLTVPFTRGAFTLGTWQQVVFIDFDTRPRSRRIVVQFIGE
jgi:secondary thiamine-phosphate synthase enzyme